MNRHLTNRLAAHAGTHASELIVYADGAGATAEAVVVTAWKRLLAGLKPGPHMWTANRRFAENLMSAMSEALWIRLQGSIGSLIVWSHKEAADAMLKTLPKDYLRAAAQLRESRDALSDLSRGGRTTGNARLVEASLKHEFRGE